MEIKHRLKHTEKVQNKSGNQIVRYIKNSKDQKFDKNVYNEHDDVAFSKEDANIASMDIGIHI